MRKKNVSLILAVVWIMIAAETISANDISFIEVQRDGVKGAAGLYGAGHVTVSPDGKHVYATGPLDDAVVVFSRAGTSGQLTFVEYHQDDVNGVDGLYGAGHVTVSPDGKHVYATGPLDDAIAVFSRDATSGQLTFVEYHRDDVNGIDGLHGAGVVAVSPDGKCVYVTGPYDRALAVFSRDATSGQLTFVEYHQDDVSGVEGIYGAGDVALSPDGKSVYATGPYDSAIAVFGRDPNSGELSFVEYHKNGEKGVDGLNGARNVSVSPDGKNVYVTGYSDDAVVVFSRDAISGQLTYIEQQKDGIEGVRGLYTPTDLTVSPDGSHLYTTGFFDKTLVIFSRNEISGRLTFVKYARDGVNGVDGLDGTTSVSVSPDGSHVYATGNYDNAIVVFQLLPDSLAFSTATTAAGPLKFLEETRKAKK